MNKYLPKTNLSLLMSVALCVMQTPMVNAALVDIDSASDWGGGHESYPASNAIDGNTAWSSRWAANDAPVNLVLDLGATENVDEVHISWGKGDEITHTFEIRARASTSDDWTKIYSGSSTGATTNLQDYNVDDIEARYIRVKVFENSAATQWTNITEVEIYNTSDVPNYPGDYGLDASVAPSGNFDLLDWYLSIPIDEGDGYATSIKENALAASYEDDFFYTGSDGGMVFYTPVDGKTTSSGTKYVRTELREMLRRGDTSISTSGSGNNWAFSSIASSDQDDFAGIDGVLSATLAINHVTTTSSNNEHVGRLVVGQIHASSNEPIRLYYHKLPGNTNGAIYFAHEPTDESGNDETWYNLLGSMVDSSGDLSSTSNPSAGIALNEHFSYSITVNGDDLTVIISQAGTQLASKTVDMSDSGFDDADNYMYFKAGLYLQDNSSDGDDYAEVTFYKLSNTHDNYDN